MGPASGVRSCAIMLHVLVPHVLLIWLNLPTKLDQVAHNLSSKLGYKLLCWLIPSETDLDGELMH